MKKLIIALVAILAVSVGLNIGLYNHITQPIETMTDTVEVVTIVEHRDSSPQIKSEQVTGYVTVHPRSEADSICNAPAADSICTFPTMQRTFTDDSTYTAYVSGPKVDTVGPQLDSIHIYSRETTQTVTVTRTLPRRHWHIGLGGGYGYGLSTRKTDVWIGVTATYEL